MKNENTGPSCVINKLELKQVRDCSSRKSCKISPPAADNIYLFLSFDMFGARGMHIVLSIFPPFQFLPTWWLVQSNFCVLIRGVVKISFEEEVKSLY